MPSDFIISLNRKVDPMKRSLLSCLALIVSFAITPRILASTSETGWVPSGLPPFPDAGSVVGLGGFLTPEQGKAVLDAAVIRFPDRASWENYSQLVRLRIQQGAGLMPWPKRTPLNSVIRSLRNFDG